MLELEGFIWSGFPELAGFVALKWAYVDTFLNWNPPI